MSMLTCCPVCSTMFKVVPDQLRISQGWVRCGRCAEVFDATAHLQERQPALPRPPTGLRGWQPGGASAPNPDPADATQNDAAAAALLAEALAFAGKAPAQDSGGDGEGYSGFTLLRPDDASPVREGDSGPAPLESEGQADTAPVEPEPSKRSSMQDEDAAASDDAFDEYSLDDDTAPTFVQQARRRDLWRRPGVRAALGFAGLLLAALLLVQYALHHRDALAARAPALAGPLRALCGATGCTVGAPRQIDAIVIDSSTFSRLRADGYRLSLTLKNKAQHAVAMPAVELTLTDSRDQPVLRRVLMPGDLGARSRVLGPASEWSGTLGLTVLAEGSPARVSGYRVLAFYP